MPKLKPSKDFVDPTSVTPQVIFGGLIGAIIWNLATWYFGLPSSSSHALIGGVVGAVLVAAGTGAVDGKNLLSKLLIPALIAPVLAFCVAGLAILVASSDIEDLLAVCDRVVVLRDGHVVGELERQAMTKSAIVGAMEGVHSDQQA